MTKKGYIILFIVFVTVTSIIRYFTLEESSVRSLLTQTMVAGIIFTGLIYFVKRKRTLYNRCMLRQVAASSVAETCSGSVDKNIECLILSIC